MSISGLQPPPPFLSSPGHPDIPWEQWIQAFKNYMVASGAFDLPAIRRKAILLNCLGLEGQRIFQTLTTTDDPCLVPASAAAGTLTSPSPDVFDRAIATLEGHFKTTLNVTAARHRFRQRTQAPGETAADYVTALRSLVGACNFGDLTDDMIRDQLIEKTTSGYLRERLLLEESLTLSKALTIAKQHDQATNEARELAQNDLQVHRVKDTSNHRERHCSTCTCYNMHGQSRISPKEQVCYRCGSTAHLANSSLCKAKAHRCRQCEKIGHLEKVCKSLRKFEKNVQHVAEGNDTADPDDHLSVCQIWSRKKGIYAALEIEGISVPFLIDTGSSVSILAEELYQRYFSKAYPLKSTSVQLLDYSKAAIPIQGCFIATASFHGRCTSVLLYVVPGGTTILGLDGIAALDMKIQGSPLRCLLMTQETPVLPPELRSEFEHLFAKELGTVRGFTHKVRVRASVQPVASKLRRLPLVIREQVSAEVQKLEAQGIIERVDSSEWVSPIVVARKKDGSIRMCVDLREPNKAVVVDSFPLPQTEELLNSLAGAQRFSKLDLASAYHQLPLSLESRDLTTFITHDGLFRFKRVCFGLASAPSAFQKMMHMILKGCKCVLFYIDDIIVYGRSREDHLGNLRAVLQRLSDAGLRLNNKCVFDVAELTFLGHVVSAKGLFPLMSSIEAITKAPSPTNINELRSLLGLAGFYSKFIPHFSDVVEPMRALLRGQASFVWSAAAQSSLERLKSLLTSCEVLHLFDPHLPVFVTTDASGYGLGAVLQQDNGTSLQTVAFASRTLQPHERKYSVGEREALACVWACEHWHVYLWGRPFILRTDHAALVTLLSTKGTGHRPLRIARWSSRLLCYNYTVEYRKGSENVVADALSRLPVQSLIRDAPEEEFICLLSPVVTMPELQEASANDQIICEVKHFTTTSWPDKKSLSKELLPYFYVKAELSVVSDILCRGDRIVVPATLTRRLMDLAHESHPGISRTKARLRESYWWPCMDSHIEELVRTCVICQSCDKSARTFPAPLQPVPLPDAAWEKIAIDIVGPFTQASADCRFAITVIDYYSKWPEVAFVRDATTSTVKKFLLELFAREGYPRSIVSDHGPQFSSASFDEFLTERGITHYNSSVYYPQANGLVERFNRVLKSYIQLALLERRDVRTAMLDYLQVYRCTPHATTGATPAVLLHRRQPRTRLDILGLPDRCFSTDPSRAIEQLREHVKKKQMISKSYTDEKRGAKEPSFVVGDYVRVKTTAAHGKLSSQFSAPKKIIGKRGPASYLLDDGRVWNASKLIAVHSGAVNKMKSGTPAVMNWTPAFNRSSHALQPETSALMNWSPASDRSSSAPQWDTSRADGHERADPVSSPPDGTQALTSPGFNAQSA